MANSTTLDNLKTVDMAAHQKALIVVSECTSEEGDGSPADPQEFAVNVHSNGYHYMWWKDYGPFGGAPAWIWDPEAAEWVSSEDDDYDRWEALQALHDS